MEKPGEQCTVVFALIGTEPASGCVCGGEGGDGGIGEMDPIRNKLLFRARI
jgi:hypothetical protein